MVRLTQVKCECFYVRFCDVKQASERQKGNMAAALQCNGREKQVHGAIQTRNSTSLRCVLMRNSASVACFLVTLCSVMALEDLHAVRKEGVQICRRVA